MASTFFVWLDVFPCVFDGLIIDYPILQWFCMAYSATKCFFTCFPWNPQRYFWIFIVFPFANVIYLPRYFNYRNNSRLRLRPTFGCCLWWFIFFKHLFYQEQCKYAMNLGVAQIRGALLQFFNRKSVLSYLCRMLPSISKITPELVIQKEKDWLIKLSCAL